MRTFAFASCLLLIPAVAAAEDAISVELHPKALMGHDAPSLVVHANQRVAKLRLELDGPGGKLRRSAGPLRAGTRHRFDLPADRTGVLHFSGELKVDVSKGQGGSIPLSFDVEVLAPLELKVAPEDVQLEQHRLRLSANRPVRTVQVTLTGDRGEPLGTVEVDALEDEEGKIPVAWEAAEGTVLRIAVKATDPAGYYAGLDLYPWRLEIPHEDVNFASGKADIPKEEVPKLEAALQELQAALTKYGRLVDGVKLYIAGHTDRVGDAASNQVLSEKRARSIGAWFRKRGVKVSIHYAGFGERLPAVQTEDEVERSENRRAAYIVAIEPPNLGVTASWRRL